MTNHKEKSSWMRVLAIYYGILQTVHMIFLARAGFIILNDRRMPFPALPPESGWNPQILPFFIGMGIADAVAAGLGFYFIFQLYIRSTRDMTPGIISLTTAFSSGFVFLIGTIASGAWNQHFTGYIILVLVFIPVVLLYVLLLKESNKTS